MRVKGLPYAGVICPTHGKVDIDKIQYISQMRDVDSRWKCPKCGQISEFDDCRFEALHPEEET